MLKLELSVLPQDLIKTIKYPSSDTWFINLQMMLEIATDNSNLEDSNPNLLKAFHLLTNEQPLSKEKKQRLLEQIKSILTSQKDFFDNKLQQFLNDIEFPDSTEALLRQIGPELNELQPLQVLLRIKENLVHTFTTQYAYQGHQEQGYEPDISAKYPELFNALFANSPESIPELFIFSQQEIILDINWKKLLYFIFKDYQRKGIIIAQPRVMGDPCDYVGQLLNETKVLDLNQQFLDLGFYQLMQYFHVHINEFTAFLLLTNKNQNSISIVIHYLSVINKQPKSTFTITLGILLSALKKDLDFYKPLLQAINARFQISDQLNPDFFLSYVIPSSDRLAPYPLDQVLSFLDFCTKDQKVRLLFSFYPWGITFFGQLLWQFSTCPQNNDMLLSQCDELTAEEFWLLISLKVTYYGNLLSYLILKTQGTSLSEKERFKQIITKLNSLIERKLPHEQKGLLLQDKDKLGYSILFSACAYTPELMPVYLDWLEKLEPAIQFSILQQTYLIKSTSSSHQTLSISILYMIIMSNPQLLAPLLNVFKKLDVIFRRQLLVFVEPARERNLFHEAMKLDRQQLTSFLQAIKEVDSRLLIQLLLQYDIKSLPPIVSLLENKELIDIVLKELEPMSEAERKLLFSYCTKEKPSFINILFRNSPEHFEKWLYPYLTHLKVDPSTLLPQPQYPFQSLLILVSHASMIANLPLYYRAMLNCYSQNHTQEYSLYNLSSFSALIFQASLGNNTLNHHIDYILKNLNDFSKKPALKLLKELVYLHIEKIPHEYKKFLESLRHQEELLQNLLSDEDQKGLNLIQNILLFKELELPNLETVLETYHEQNLLYASLLKTNSRNLTVLKHTMLHRQSFLDTLLKAISSFSTQQQLTLMTGANNILLFSVINVPSGLKTLLSLEPTIHEQCLKEKSLWETAFQNQHNFKTLVACLDKLEDANKSSVLASLESLDSNIYESITDLLDSPIEPEAKKACSFKP